jgi:hypothetical protein
VKTMEEGLYIGGGRDLSAPTEISVNLVKAISHIMSFLLGKETQLEAAAQSHAVN